MSDVVRESITKLGNAAVGLFTALVADLKARLAKTENPALKASLESLVESSEALIAEAKQTLTAAPDADVDGQADGCSLLVRLVRRAEESRASLAGQLTPPG